MGRAFKTTLSILGALAVSTAAQVPLAAAQEYYDNPAVAQSERLTQRELDALLAPIALYPDQLLAPLLMAATYPHDVEAAADWTARAQNASLRGDGLAFAIEPFEWDPSVKTLAQFPDVLRMLDYEWDWMVRVGNAFLLQETDVMDSVQRLRHQAYAMGALRSTDLQRVRFDNGAVVIDMIDPATVYIPTYNPVQLYGAWFTPDYQPYYFRRPIIVTRYAVVPSLWGWSSWEWSRHRIRVDMPRYRYFSRSAPWRFNDDTWRHDRSRSRPANFRRDEWRRDDRRPDNNWRDNDRRDNDRRDGNWGGRNDGPRRDGPDRDRGGDRDDRRDRRDDQRANIAPGTPMPPGGGFRGNPDETRRRFEENRRAEGAFRGRQNPSTPQPDANAQPNGQDRGRGFRGEADRQQFRQERRAPDRQAYAGPQLTPPGPIAPMTPQPPADVQARQERRRDFFAAGATRTNPQATDQPGDSEGRGRNRSEFNGQDRPDRQMRQRGGNGGGGDGDGQGPGNGRGRRDRD